MNGEKKAEKVSQFVQSGMTVKAACKKVGISTPSYYARRKRNKSKLTQIPVVQPQSQSRMLAMVGSPAEIMETLRGLL